MGARFAENAAFYIITVFVLTFSTQHLKLPKSIVLNAVLIASGVHFLVIPLFGLLSDWWGRRPLYLTGAALMAGFAWPFFWLMETRSPFWITVAISLGLVIHAAMYAPQAAFFSELFGTDVRYSGVSFGYQLASPFAGGLAPFIASSLLTWSNGHFWPVAAYIVAMCGVTLLSVWLAEETHLRDLTE